MSKSSIRQKKTQKIIAKRRIHYLFRLAEKNALSGNIDMATRYISHARNISMRYLTPIPRELKRQFCKHCYHYLLPTITCRVRITKGKIKIFCFHCKKYTRVPIK